MDAQSDNCEHPPYNPQPPGKIRKALKLFSKRKPGSGVARIFSVKEKSKTLDGLTEAEAEAVDLDPEDSHKDFAAFEEPASIKKHNFESSSTRQSICSLTSAKSLSFLSMLRWNRKGGGEKIESQTESHRSGQQRKGLKNLFGSVRWQRKDREDEDEAFTGPPLLASRSNSVEIIKENLTLTSKPKHHFTEESDIEKLPSSQNDHLPPEDTKVSGAAKPATNERLSMHLGDISSTLSLDTLEGGVDIVADVEAEWVKVSSHGEVKASTAESVKKKALLCPKSESFLSSSSTIPSSTTKPISLSIPAKTMPSPTTKQTFSPTYTSSPTTLIKPNPSHISSATFSLKIKPLPSSVLIQDSFLIPSNIIPDNLTYHKSHPTTPTLTIRTKPKPTPTSPLTPEPSPKPSPTICPYDFPDICKSFIPDTENDSERAAAPAMINEPTHIPSETTTLNAASIPITRATQSISQDSKHSSAPVTKYPPFITSTKPVQTAPVIRPKIVTTFGLSTSRNTAPIIKPEPKASAPQNKSCPLQIEKNGSGSVIQKVSLSELRSPNGDKHLLVASDQPTSATLSATFKKHSHKEQPVEKDVANARVVEDTQPDSSYKPEKKTLIMKPTTLSRIPISGGGKLKQHQKDVQSNGEERLWNLPTPVHEEGVPISLDKEGSSMDALSNLFTESSSTDLSSNEDIIDSASCSTMGKVSIHKESKIPIKQGSTATNQLFQGKTEVARSKIPVSKVPVRRINNKTGSTSTAAATRK